MEQTKTQVTIYLGNGQYLLLAYFDIDVTVTDTPERFSVHPCGETGPDEDNPTMSMSIVDCSKADPVLVSKGDVDNFDIDTKAVVWKAASVGCNYPPFHRLFLVQ